MPRNPSAGRSKSAAPPTPRGKASDRGVPGMWLTACTGFYLALLGIITAGNLIGPEIWWFGSLNLYLPQWPWAIPGVLLFFWYAAKARRLAWIPLVAILWVAGPLMGFSWRWASNGAPPDGTRLRVMTYNIKWGTRDADSALAQIARYEPDVIMMQDAGGVLNTAVGMIKGDWHVRTLDQYVIASKFPLDRADVRWISYPDQTHRVMRCSFDLKGRNIVLYSAHLMTPRWGLGSIRHPRSQGVGTLEANVTVRVKQSEQLAKALAAEQNPVILGGDLNAPAQSTVCRQLFGVGMQDAFSAAGRGYGYTYGHTTKVQSPYVRIDHVLVSKEWQVLDCWAGDPAGSDHCPVIADVFLPNAR